MSDVKTYEKSIAISVAEKIASSTNTVIDAVVNTLAEKEVARRIDAVTKVYNLINENTKQLSKMKADVIVYDENSVVISSNWTKGALDSRKKLVDKHNKLNNALAKALDKNDFSDLFNLASGKESPKETTEDESV